MWRHSKKTPSIDQKSRPYHTLNLPVPWSWTSYTPEQCAINFCCLLATQSLVQMVPNLWWFNLWFFSFMMVWKWYSFSRNSVQILNFDLFPDYGYMVWCSLAMLGSKQWVVAPSKPHNQKDKQWIHLKSFCTHTTIPFFTFSTVFNKLYIFNMLL